jgi:hypothetical protein
LVLVTGYWHLQVREKGYMHLLGIIVGALLLAFVSLVAL